MKTKEKGLQTWSKWDARDYLNTYYQYPMADSRAILTFIHDSLGKLPGRKFKKALEFGSGPTVYGLLGIEPYVDEIHISDYLPQNLLEVKNWADNSPGAFNWDKFTQYALSLERGRVTQNKINLHAQRLRKKIKDIFKGNIKKRWPLLNHKERYDLVVSLFCADSITSSKKNWFIYMNNLLSIANEGGVLMVVALRKCKSYKVGNFRFPSANVNEDDFKKAVLLSGREVTDMTIEVKKVPECRNDGYSSIILAQIVFK